MSKQPLHGVPPSDARRGSSSRAEATAPEADDQLLPDNPRTRRRGAATHVETSRDVRLAALRGPHWLESTPALEAMRQMTVSVDPPPRKMKITQMQGSPGPILIILCLSATRVGQLASLDRFWRRIVGHVTVWRSLHCRDQCYCDRVPSISSRSACSSELGGSPVNDRTRLLWHCPLPAAPTEQAFGMQECVWRTLEGRRGADRCLFHLSDASPEDFRALCKKITAIPGRSNEELLEAYRKWTSGNVSNARQNEATAAEDGSPPSEGATTATALPPKPWTVRAHCSYGLTARHSRPPAIYADKLMPVATHKLAH